MQDTLFISTSIPYVNSRPHIGFALELVQADALARYQRLLGNKVHFQTGTDDNAFKNVLSAREEGIGVKELVDRNSGVFRDLSGILGISTDGFIQTSDPPHGVSVHRLWQQLKSDDLYVKRYAGLYCNGCEDFYLEKDLVDGRCPDHDTEPAVVEETNYFFRLSAYQHQLTELLRSDGIRIVPDARRNEILRFLDSGLQDISVSRNSTRSGGWGITVPSDDSQTIYVWIDALINYISGLGYGRDDRWQAFWSKGTRKIHVIGKDVWKFHSIYWPSLLLSAGLPLPDEILIHGFLTVDGRKISKSRGNGVDPFAFAEEYGADGLRYYLLRAISPFEDGDFSAQRVRQVYNSDLANGLGNLVKRLSTLWRRGHFGGLTLPDTPPAPENYHAHLNAYEFNRALQSLWGEIGQLNRDIDQKRPWESLKTTKALTLKRQLLEWFRSLYAVAYWLEPFLPGTSRKVTDILASDPGSDEKPLFPRAN